MGEENPNLADLANTLEKQGEGEKIAASEVAQRLSGLLGNHISQLSDEDVEAVADFIKQATFSDLDSHFDKYEAKNFDIDDEAGLDRVEFEAFENNLNNALQEIIALGNFDEFVEVREDILTDI